MKKKFSWKVLLVILIIIVGLTYTAYIYKNDLIENLEDDIYISFMQNLTRKCTENDKDFIDKYLDNYKDEAKEIVDMLSKR